MTDVFSAVEHELGEDARTRLRDAVRVELPFIALDDFDEAAEEAAQKADEEVSLDLSVALQGNAPLAHYRRADLDASLHRGFQSRAKAGHGFLYALAFPGANGMQIGIGVSSAYDLNRQHQPLDVIHYNDVMSVAAQIADGSYNLADGPLTQRFFGDEAAYKKTFMETGGYRLDPNGTFTKTGIALRSGALAVTMEALHREVWGNPLADADVIVTDPDYTPFDVVVRYDSFLKRIVIGLTPKNALWKTLWGGQRVPDPQCSHNAEPWQFCELLRLNKRDLKHAITRWREAGAVRLPVNRAGMDIHVSGDRLVQLLCALTRHGAERGWETTIS